MFGNFLWDLLESITLEDQGQKKLRVASQLGFEHDSIKSRPLILLSPVAVKIPSPE